MLDYRHILQIFRQTHCSEVKHPDTSVCFHRIGRKKTQKYHHSAHNSMTELPQVSKHIKTNSFHDSSLSFLICFTPEAKRSSNDINNM